MTAEWEYYFRQCDLACLDALQSLSGPHSEYRLCLRFAWNTGAAIHAVGQMFEANGAATFEQGEP